MTRPTPHPLLARLCWLSVAVGSLLFGPTLLDECVAKPFVAVAVTEADTTPPTHQSTTIAANGQDVSTVFDEAVVVADATGFTLTPSGGAAALTYASGSGTTTINWTASRVLLDDETATIAYSSTTGDVTDAASNELATFGATAVANNSTQTDAPDAPVITSHGGTASISRDENLVAVAAMTATPSVGAWSLSGTDAALFEFVGTSGGSTTLSFIAAPDYETPTDAGADNVYNVTVAYTNETGTDSTAWTITVVDVTDESEPVLAAGTTQWVADEGSISFTPTVLQGDGLKFTATNLPTGLSAGSGFSTSTGALSGTLSTPGLYKTRITAYVDTDADDIADADEPQDHITVGVIVYSSTVTLDAAYVAANDEADGRVNLLGSAHTRFQFAENLDFAGHAFVLANPNLYVDGAGYTLHWGGLNAVTTANNLFPNREHGFEIYQGSADVDGYYPPTITGGTEALNCAIVNLTMVADGTDPQSHGVDGRRSEGIYIAECNITAAGKDSHAVFLVNNNFGAVLLNNIFTTTASTSFDRHAGPACVGTSGTTRYNIERCLLLGGNSSITCGSSSEIYKNVLSHIAPVTNGYGIFAYRNSNIIIKDNLILPLNGRGILFNAGSGHVATGNVILHLEEPNGEFGSELNPPAVRGRYDTSNITYTGNTSLGIGGTGVTAASTLYITSDGTGSSNYSNNTGDVILIGTPDADSYAQSITLEGTTNGIDVVNSNTLRSNHNLIRVEGFDGFTRQITPLRENSFEWVTGTDAYTDFTAAVDAKYATFGMVAAVASAAETRIAAIDTLVDGLITGVPLYGSRVAWHVKKDSHSGTEAYMDVLDSDWGTVDSDSWTIGSGSLSSGSVKVREGFTQSVLLKDSGGTPLSSVVVNVTSDQGDSYTATTDASGNATLTFYRFAIVKADAAGASVSVVNRTSSTVSYGGESAAITHASVPADLELQ